MKLRSDLAIISDWIEPGSRVLDLGCGDGTLLAQLRDTKSVTGYGVEFDLHNINACLARGINVIHRDLDQGLAEFENSSFDYVIMSQTIQAVHFPDRVLVEMLRVGRDCMVTFPNAGHWAARLHLAWHGKMPQSKALPHEWYNTPNLHLCSVGDFEDLCHKLDILILSRTMVDYRYHQNTLLQILPNLLGEIAIYHIRKR
jgi:methionine biosynthesis protein MetW